MPPPRDFGAEAPAVFVSSDFSVPARGITASLTRLLTAVYDTFSHIFSNLSPFQPIPVTSRLTTSLWTAFFGPLHAPTHKNDPPTRLFPAISVDPALDPSSPAPGQPVTCGTPANLSLCPITSRNGSLTWNISDEVVYNADRNAFEFRAAIGEDFSDQPECGVPFNEDIFVRSDTNTGGSADTNTTIPEGSAADAASAAPQTNEADLYHPTEHPLAYGYQNFSQLDLPDFSDVPLGYGTGFGFPEHKSDSAASASSASAFSAASFDDGSACTASTVSSLSPASVGTAASELTRCSADPVTECATSATPAWTTWPAVCPVPDAPRPDQTRPLTPADSDSDDSADSADSAAAADAEAEAEAEAGADGGSLRHMCEICGQRFRIKGYLTRHVKKHSLTKAFNCPFFDPLAKNPCHQHGGFSRRDTYKTHLKSRHFLYPPGTRSVQRSGVAGRCAHCKREFGSNEEWVEKHIQTGECPAVGGGAQRMRMRMRMAQQAQRVQQAQQAQPRFVSTNTCGPQPQQPQPIYTEASGRFNGSGNPPGPIRMPMSGAAVSVAPSISSVGPAPIPIGPITMPVGVPVGVPVSGIAAGAFMDGYGGGPMSALTAGYGF